MKSIRSGQRGSALILATVIIIIVAGLGAAFATLSFSQSSATMKSANSESSLYMAEAGLEDTINKMNAYADAEWTWLKQNPTMQFSQFPLYGGMTLLTDYNVFGTIATVVVNGVTTTQSVLPVKAVNGGTYSVTVTPAFDGQKRPYTIASRGLGKNEARKVETVVGPAPSNGQFRYGLFGEVLLNVYGSNGAGGSSSTGADVKVDSYKSTLGSYTSQMKSYSVNGSSVDAARVNGNIAANGNVITSQSMIIMGNVTAGPGIAPQTNGAYINGTVSSLATRENFPVDAYKPSPATSSGPLSGSKTYLATGASSAHVDSLSMVTKDTLTFTGVGTFDLYVDGNIDVKGLITIDKDVKVTIHQNGGTMTINGQGIANASQSPDHFTLTSNSADTAGKFNGGSQFFGSVYAPKMNVSLLGNGEIFGAVVANSITFGGTAQFHYDEDLNISNFAPPVFRISSWRETVK